MPTSMIRDREIIYNHETQRWHWSDTTEVLDEETEAKHFSTKPPGQVWAEEDAKPKRSRSRAADTPALEADIAADEADKMSPADEADTE